MKFSYSIPTSINPYGELVVIEIENLEELIKLCKRIRNKNGQFWPPIEEQLYKKAGYDEKQVFKYNEFCKKLKGRIENEGPKPSEDNSDNNTN